MAKVQSNDVVSAAYCGPDRRRGGPVRLQRWIITLVRSRWVAAFVTAFVVSYSFHALETRTDHKIERQQQLTMCVIKGVDEAQRQVGPSVRVELGPILQQCEKQPGKK